MNLSNTIITVLMILILLTNLYLVLKSNISESMSNKPNRPKLKTK